MKAIATFSIAALATCFSLTASASDCMGFPTESNFKILKEGKCLGVIATKKSIGWRAPRKVLALENGVFAITDFGGWGRPTGGKVWIYNIHTQEKYVLRSGGKMTHGLGIDSKGRLLIGDGDQILRGRTPGVAKGTEFETVVSGLKIPTQKGSHPFKHFIVLNGQDQKDDLIVNIGSGSDSCGISAKNKSCKERESDPESLEEGEAELRRYFYDPATDSYQPSWLDAFTVKNYQVVARGLRNSMALAQSPHDPNVVFQAENNMDSKNTPEEMNVVTLNAESFSSVLDFGWPFCAGKKIHTPFRRFLGNNSKAQDLCSNKAADPLFNIPAHAAPLDMMIYKGRAHTDLNGKILMTWHGYRTPERYGLVAYSFGEDGMPLSKFEPLVASNSKRNRKAKLSLVGVTADRNGNIFFVDDKTGTFYVYGNGDAQLPPPGENEELPSALVDKLDKSDDIFDFVTDLTPQCAACHSEIFESGNPIDTLRNLLDFGWIEKGISAEDSEFFKRMKGVSDQGPSMPRGGLPLAETHEQLYRDLVNWVNSNVN